MANAAIEPDSEWGESCIQACLDVLTETVASGRIVLDDEDLIVSEYFRQLSRTGMPGVGDHFAKWAWDHRFIQARCSLVSLTRLGSSFAEFPSDPGLAHFDPSDQKFVAAACCHGVDHDILQAVDSKWWGLRAELAAAGVNVTFVCQTKIEALHQRKSKSKSP